MTTSADIVVSLDFELRWGVQDVVGRDFSRYRRNIEGVLDAVPAILEAFASRGVRATWAIVGAIACDGWDEWRVRAPAWPVYHERALRWDEHYRAGDPSGRLYFAPQLVEKVRRSSGQELGSHTFSHIYLGEPGLVKRDAVDDARSMVALFGEKWGLVPQSFVFPRNQVAFVDVLLDHGCQIWRGNPTPFFWSATTAAQQSSLVRGLRFADALLPLGTRSYWRDTRVHRASHFVRFTLPGPLWNAHVARLVGEARSLRPGSVLHLWWHPHNLGGDVALGRKRLEHLFDALREGAPSFARFSSMGDLSRGDTSHIRNAVAS